MWQFWDLTCTQHVRSNWFPDVRCELIGTTFAQDIAHRHARGNVQQYYQKLVMERNSDDSSCESITKCAQNIKHRHTRANVQQYSQKVVTDKHYNHSKLPYYDTLSCHRAKVWLYEVCKYCKCLCSPNLRKVLIMVSLCRPRAHRRQWVGKFILNSKWCSCHIWI